MAAQRKQSSNGICERNWQSIKVILSLLIEEYKSNWVDEVEHAVQLFNDRIHSATGVEPRKPRFGFGNPDSTDQIAEFLFRSQLRQDTVSARLRTKWSKEKKVPIQFVVGQSVLMRNTSDEAVKIGAKKRLGPYKIDKILGTKLVELEGGKKVHASHLKSFVEG